MIYSHGLVFFLGAFSLSPVWSQSFSNLLKATGVYKNGDKSPKSSATTYRPNFSDEEVRDMVEVGIISRELGEKLSRAKIESLAQAAEDASERANEVGVGLPERTPDTGRKEIATRRYELMKDDDTIAGAQSGERGGFMSRSLYSGDYTFLSVPHPKPTSLGFPAIESFYNNFENKVVWNPMRSKRDVSDKTTEPHGKDDNNNLGNAAKVDLEQIIEKEIEEVQMSDDEVDKRDAAPDASADASRLNSAHVLPPPHDVPPHAGLPLFPPLGTAPPHPHAGPTPVPSSGHHVTISTPTHHVSHGVADHGTHHAVHKEHHQVHGHGHHVTPVVQHHHMIDHHGHHAAPHHPAPHHLEPNHPAPHHQAPHHLEPHHPAPHHPAPHHPAPHHLEPHQVAAVPVLMVPPTAHGNHYDHPVSGYPKPAHGGSLEDIFGLHKPAYHAPEPAYHAPEPAYHAPEPAYHAPEPAYHAPEPAYHAPEPAYHAPEPDYHTPEPAYHAPEPAYHAPEPAYRAPEPAYHAPKPAYHAKPSYKPDYKHPTGDYVSPHAHMAGHPFSLEAVFNLGMPLYYMEKYPHMAKMMHHHDHHVEHHAPVYHPPEYKNPASGYAKPAHGASLEEIFGVHTAYHPAVPVTVHKPDYHPPKPAYHAPKPEYHPPKPAYHEPKPAYHESKPAYHEPKPAYHAPKPEYHPPKPAYHEPKPGYHSKPGHGSLEAIFGLGHAPHYDVPTTYKPKMPDYLHGHPHAKSLPPAHDPGYVLHYLPYDNYQPIHPETLAHPAPVPHHPHAAHMLVPGTHVPPGPHHHVPHSVVTPVPHHAPPHTPLLGVTPAPTPLLGVTPVPLLGVAPTPHDVTPILHPHSVLESVPALPPHPEVSELQAHPAVPFPELSFLPHSGARQKRSPKESGSPRISH